MAVKKTPLENDKNTFISESKKEAVFFLDFEKDIAELESKISLLEVDTTNSAVDLSKEINRLKKKSGELTQSIYKKLKPYEIVQVARHRKRPYTLDYIAQIFTDFYELHGDRHSDDDQSIVGGLARFNNEACMVVGHQKGRDTKERQLRNFGYPKPEAYRKALRLFKTAEKFSLPVFTFIDTPGAWPGIDAEEHNQSEAIGRNLFEMASLRTPIISTVIGEGGSGGALAIGVCDKLLMLQFATYSVISPESCSSILWHDAAHTVEAANALKLTAPELKTLGLIDEIIEEPIGGAQYKEKEAALFLKNGLEKNFAEIKNLPLNKLLARRKERLLSYGSFLEQPN